MGGELNPLPVQFFPLLIAVARPPQDQGILAMAAGIDGRFVVAFALYTK